LGSAGTELGVIGLGRELRIGSSILGCFCGRCSNNDFHFCALKRSVCCLLSFCCIIFHYQISYFTLFLLSTFPVSFPYFLYYSCFSVSYFFGWREEKSHYRCFGIFSPFFVSLPFIVWVFLRLLLPFFFCLVIPF